MNIVYGLIDPRDGSLRYVGKSTSGLHRARQHARPFALKNEFTHKANWVRSLVAAGLTPEIEVLEEAVREVLADAEHFWIAYFRGLGCDLTNLTDGGDGTLGWKPSDEVKSKISAATKGRGRGVPKSAEHRAKIAESNRKVDRSYLVGRVKTAEERARLSAALKGKPKDPAAVAKRAAALRGKFPPEHYAALAKRLTGSKRTPEQRARMGEAQRRRRESERRVG